MAWWFPHRIRRNYMSYNETPTKGTIMPEYLIPIIIAAVIVAMYLVTPVLTGYNKK
ncbi:hypothetical protein SEA_OHMYWARD_44 [Gordonia phage OhMyWard]|uniref:Uncharacterized protein n=1 Tax=Gordonia phage OhMyWard TaxID=2652414 RepID=A0A5P8D7E2_9CAUD|nr:hypothetical protein HWC72_gp44 [Gordonia phage OhMyWard]QFP94926.1 hypothetical protein SEA_OHMYWARD_44 [Gordonia phage OhMyWard]